MKVLGTVNDGYGNADRFIVEIHKTEMTRISGCDGCSAMPRAGHTVEVCKLYNHAMNILREAEKAKKLPSQLRTLAEMIEMSIPAITGIIEEQEAKA